MLSSYKRKKPLDDKFEEIISNFLVDRVGEMDNFLGQALATNLKQNLLVLFGDNQFKAAGIGSGSNFTNNRRIRSDMIYWLSQEHNDLHENSFFTLMDAFVAYLNKTCYTGITGYEFHYAYYDTGTSYKRHLDQFKENTDRAYSMIMYLNENWQLEDGGQLRIYHDDNTQTISPRSGKCVFFKSSELEHEVLLSHKPRMSITGWLKTNAT